MEILVAAMVAGFGSGEQPRIGGRGILGCSKAIHQQEAKFDAGRSVALLRGFLEPEECVVVTLMNAEPTEIKIGEIALAEGVALFGGEAIPARSGRIVLHDTEASVA